MAATDLAEAMIWLGRAADEGWTVEQLKEAIAGATGTANSSSRAEKLISFSGTYADMRPHLNKDGVVDGYDLVIRVNRGTQVDIDNAVKFGGMYTYKMYSIPEELGGDDGSA